jgi:hypothetical protein
MIDQFQMVHWFRAIKRNGPRYYRQPAEGILSKVCAHFMLIRSY